MPAEGRGFSSEPTSKVGKDRRLGNLATPTSVQKLRTALHAKAKEEPKFRFYALYDRFTGWTCWNTPMPVAAPTRAHRE